jgi:hypothetical protein
MLRSMTTAIEPARGEDLDAVRRLLVDQHLPQRCHLRTGRPRSL